MRLSTQDSMRSQGVAGRLTQNDACPRSGIQPRLKSGCVSLAPWRIERFATSGSVAATGPAVFRKVQRGSPRQVRLARVLPRVSLPRVSRPRQAATFAEAKNGASFSHLSMSQGRARMAFFERVLGRRTGKPKSRSQR